MARWALAAMLALALPAAAEPAVLAHPGAPGPDRAPGHSALEALFPEGLPFPFAAVLDRLRDAAGEANVATALIPLGRSLQRYGAHPDYFASPRIVVAITGDAAAGPADARLADRVFLAYQPAAEVIEAIAWNEAAARFEFQEVVGYAPGQGAIEPAERRVCTACHQGHGPIFPRPLWAETNASPAVAARLAPLGDSFHGVPVAASVDTLDALDAATDRAARLALANRLWADGCPDPACRAALLAAAIRTGLGADPGPAPTAFGTHWPHGLALIPPDLPNRDPLLEGTSSVAALETEGALDPETPRPPVVAWLPGPEGFAKAAREVAALLSPGDLAWINARLAPRAAGETVSLGCTTGAVATAAGPETRFACTAPAGRAHGFVAPDGAGRIESLWLGDSAAGRIAVAAAAAGGAMVLRPPGPAPRLADGRRIAEAVLEGGAVAIRLQDDLGPLAQSLRDSVGHDALGPGPFDRRAVLTLIEALTEPPHG